MIIRVKVDEQVFEVEVGDLSARPILAKVGSQTFEVTPEEAGSPSTAAATVEAPAAPVSTNGNGANGSDGVRIVTAPIPGVIIAVTAHPGDHVTHGQELCVLEAMKMKNSIRATREGTVEKIHVAVGAQVRQGQPLVTYTD